MHTAKKKTKLPVTPVVLRLPPEFLSRVDAYLERLRASSPEGLRLTRSDALRALIASGLAASEKGATS